MSTTPQDRNTELECQPPCVHCETPAQRVAAFLDGWAGQGANIDQTVVYTVANRNTGHEPVELATSDLREVLERLAKYEAAVSAVLAVKPMRKMSSNDPRAEGHAEALVTVREKLHNELPHPRN